MDYNQIIDKLSVVLSTKRLQHSLGVSQSAAQLADRFGENVEKAKFAGVLHDCARGLASSTLLQKAASFAIVVNDVERCQPTLLHAPVGAYLAKNEYGVDDPQIFRAIMLHTTGGRDMTVLDKIIYLADCIEPSRDFPGIDKLRSLAFADLDKAVLAAFDQSLHYVIGLGLLIHPATVEGRNDLLQKINK
ncbi:bis(5'-nucleosyl)-tetraphosphatase (symmetrical) YqeK [Sporomusa acidovorans]|uniref:bis(5'-nucleosyl)-tetraphosphatase (symmetrical) n=1 Tax=Sporomusa acidovorans (strain ATCC 49682 / DSM 3132 / Mol) TaxID=1123286 RepID=A0ABZ3J224_SPOA4|nr:bis(5'-nucleosyl)-tetraphosphatase (symmetrical) YqeK [Sporomusa acidovorans]OZC22530.1 ribonuclease Y [Sporomusa acidovorans DSM 3132]SDE72860.1 putative HD superfamily hydrolase of NAD metabolism [Sporomusa acidovorans]